jgi:tryptophan synthase alpha chain
MAAAGIDPVLVAAASTPPETIEKIARLSSAYVYCVTRAGITGVHSQAAFDAGLLERLREQAAAPAMFGFGIYTPAHVRGALDAGAAGAISGSAVVSLIADTPDPVPAVCNFVASLKAATLPRR